MNHAWDPAKLGTNRFRRFLVPGSVMIITLVLSQGCGSPYTKCRVRVSGAVTECGDLLPRESRWTRSDSGTGCSPVGERCFALLATRGGLEHEARAICAEHREYILRDPELQQVYHSESPIPYWLVWNATGPDGRCLLEMFCQVPTRPQDKPDLWGDEPSKGRGIIGSPVIYCWVYAPSARAEEDAFEKLGSSEVLVQSVINLGDVTYQIGSRKERPRPPPLPPTGPPEGPIREP